MRRMTALLVAMALATAFATTALAQNEAAPEKGVRGFTALDANGDGKVTREEFIASYQKRAEARFAKLDAAGKGYLTKEDFVSAREKQREKAQARKAKNAPAAQ